MEGDAGGNMYPDVTAIRERAKHAAPASAISIASTSSESSAPPQFKPRVTAPMIVLSDSEDDEPEIVSAPQPLRSFPPNTSGPNASNNVPSKPKRATPIRVPSNKDLPVSRSAPEHNYETFDMPAVDNMYDPPMSQADAEKALRELVTGAYGHEEDVEISMEDAEVEGFRPGIKLLTHQIASRKWMASRESGKKMGGILADDMGLGKTIQTITRIVDGRISKKDKADGYARATLVACPVAVVSQWASEIQKIAIGLTVVEHHGPSRASDPSQLERAHVVITSYQTIASEYGAYNPAADKSNSKKTAKSQSQVSDDSDSDSIGKILEKSKRGGSSKKSKDALFRVKWYRVVLDEAHNIKNRNTKAAQACCALHAKYRWCLTGTPMQNSVEELYSLFKFLRVRPLNDWPTFREQIAQPVKAGKTTRAMKRLQVVLSATMLRRTKDTLINGKPILQLPDRKVEVVDCVFEADERAFYETINARVQTSLEKLQQQGGVAKNYTSMLVLLLRLRQTCNHPTLVSEDYRRDKEAVEPRAAKSQDGDEDADDLADQLAGMGLSQIRRCQLCQTELTSSNTSDHNTCADCAEVVVKARRSSRGPDSDLPPDSTKTRKILEILRDIDERSEGTEKTIIFSQFTSMLDIIEPFLRAEGIRFVRYDGSMTKPHREIALESIKENARTKVILISFKAGSTGLNLTCCNNVILVDLWWNPALEDQAFDRAHRFGQTRNVHIRKLCVPDTVEQKILELQDRKRELAKAALSGDKLKNMRLGAEDLVALFGSGHDDDDDDD
ncbi:uncharacterized protein FIBRA_07629 [Fibroporia radiculosa]|uniref:Helicase ATP-binding domain-containing protein n=1 Tax=Fibroporia radiculosa TaxID=599839 RepID=J4I112_9APHY|nr:uncharacterized protein FIBRA_07629 [Fibroporia radiculosa]CCM05412.1 predicted protein [Fibroporia radiculosa]